MLDQNTDRMWFVIGAVIIGAAIIFIANGTMPELFASMADSFEGVTDAGTATVEQIGVVDEPYNIIDDVEVIEGWWVRQNIGDLSNSSNGGDHAVTGYMRVRGGRDYEFVMSDTTHTNMRVAYYDRNKNYIAGEHVYGKYMLSTAPRQARYARASARFREGDYGPSYTPHEQWYFGWVKDE